MVTVYVLMSLSDGARYTGMAVDLHNRLLEHNAGKNRYTKAHIPWKIIYTEVLPDWKSARVREKYLKSAAGRKWLQKFLGNGCFGLGFLLPFFQFNETLAKFSPKHFIFNSI